jgi:hypothetical protein
MFNNSHKIKIYIILHYIFYVRFKLWLDVIAWVSSIIKSGRHKSKNYLKQSAKLFQNISCTSRWIGSIFIVFKKKFSTHTDGATIQSANINKTEFRRADHVCSRHCIPMLLKSQQTRTKKHWATFIERVPCILKISILFHQLMHRVFVPDCSIRFK